MKTDFGAVLKRILICAVEDYSPHWSLYAEVNTLYECIHEESKRTLIVESVKLLASCGYLSFYIVNFNADVYKSLSTDEGLDQFRTQPSWRNESWDNDYVSVSASQDGIDFCAEDEFSDLGAKLANAIAERMPEE